MHITDETYNIFPSNINTELIGHLTHVWLTCFCCGWDNSLHFFNVLLERRHLDSGYPIKDILRVHGILL